MSSARPRGRDLIFQSTGLRVEGQLFGFAFPVVALHHVLDVLADGLDEPAAVVLETVADLPDQALVEYPHPLCHPPHASIIYARRFRDVLLVVTKGGTIPQAVYMEAA